MNFQKMLVVAAIAAVPQFVFASCGAGFCSINSSWTSESAATETGALLDLRYEFIDQSQPRAGSSRVAVGQISRHHNEVGTRSHNLVATYSRLYSSGWGWSVVAPIVSRDHQHIHQHRGVPINESWRFTEVGDVRLLGRYQVPVIGDDTSKPATVGVTFGLKLPTGSTSISSASGTAERSLQPGTGTTDAIVGAYYHQKLPKLGASWFAQGQFQHALGSHAAYRPGAQLGADLGLSREIAPDLAALLQLNLVSKQRDRGAAAEPADSGGRSVFLSPGLSYALRDGLQLYGFYQHPLYQYVNGVQLTLRRAVVIGVTGRF